MLQCLALRTPEAVPFGIQVQILHRRHLLTFVREVEILMLMPEGRVYPFNTPWVPRFTSGKTFSESRVSYVSLNLLALASNRSAFLKSHSD
jgi:hypothetical protein